LRVLLGGGCVGVVVDVVGGAGGASVWVGWGEVVELLMGGWGRGVGDEWGCGGVVGFLIGSDWRGVLWGLRGVVLV